MTITLTRKEAQQVLDSLLDTMPFNEIEQRVHQAAIETLRTRLAQPEPEPVADPELSLALQSKNEAVLAIGLAAFHKKHIRPLKKEWVGLTDEDRWELVQKTPSFDEAVAAIEAKLKEKNGY